MQNKTHTEHKAGDWSVYCRRVMCQWCADCGSVRPRTQIRRILCGRGSCSVKTANGLWKTCLISVLLSKMYYKAIYCRYLLILSLTD